MKALDPVTLAVLKGRLEQVADEMDATLFRSAFNPIIAEAHDASHGLYDATTGDTLVQGKSGLPIFVGAMSFAVRAVTTTVAPSCASRAAKTRAEKQAHERRRLHLHPAAGAQPARPYPENHGHIEY